LKPRMKITAYNQHDVGSFSVSLGRFFAATNVLAAIEPASLCNQSEARDPACTPPRQCLRRASYQGIALAMPQRSEDSAPSGAQRPKANDQKKAGISRSRP